MGQNRFISVLVVVTQITMTFLKLQIKKSYFKKQHYELIQLDNFI